MALYRYFSRNQGCLPDPKGSLQTAVPSHAIEAANREVGRIQDEVSQPPPKRGKYNRFDAETRATIGQYACSNGVVAAARHFSRKLERPVNETTIQNIKKAYLEEISRKRKADED